MAAHLQRYEERATDSNKRTLHCVLDMISAEGDDAMHLDILATPHGKGVSECSRPNDLVG